MADESRDPTEKPTRRRRSCPECGRVATRVTPEPVRFLSKNPERVDRRFYWFCETRGCDTVYFDDDDNRILRHELTTRVGAKEEQSPHLVCYCFGLTEEAMAADLRVHGTTAIPARIRAEIEAETCECTFRNPSGRCCLGGVLATLKRLEADRDAAGSE